MSLTFLKLKSRLDGVTGGRPVSLGSLESLQDDLATTTVLVVDQLLSVLTLLFCALLEELFETRQSLVDMARPSSQGQVDLGSLELLADLLAAIDTQLKRLGKKQKVEGYSMKELKESPEREEVFFKRMSSCMLGHGASIREKELMNAIVPGG